MAEIDKSKYARPIKGIGKGKRGRPAGQLGGITKQRLEIARMAFDEGISPLEIMLRTMRLKWKSACDAEGGTTQSELLKEASDLAAMAAPYVHPKLSAVHASQTNEITLEQWVAKLNGQSD